MNDSYRLRAAHHEYVRLVSNRQAGVRAGNKINSVLIDSSASEIAMIGLLGLVCTEAMPATAENSLTLRSFAGMHWNDHEVDADADCVTAVYMGYVAVAHAQRQMTIYKFFKNGRRGKLVADYRCRLAALVHGNNPNIIIIIIITVVAMVVSSISLHR